MNRSESPSTALRAPSPPLGEKDGMRGYGSWKGKILRCLSAQPSAVSARRTSRTTEPAAGCSLSPWEGQGEGNRLAVQHSDSDPSRNCRTSRVLRQSRSFPITMNRAVFLDRDGTIVEEKDYLSGPDQVMILPGAAEALKRLQNGGFKLFIVTNQSGIGRGYYTMEDMHRVNARLLEELGRHGVRIEKIYFAPEAP